MALFDFVHAPVHGVEDVEDSARHAFRMPSEFKGLDHVVYFLRFVAHIVEQCAAPNWRWRRQFGPLLVLAVSLCIFMLAPRASRRA